MEQRDTLPLPDDPALAAVAGALHDAGQWAEIIDRDWRYVYMTDDYRLSMGGVAELAPVPVGAHVFGSEAAKVRRRWRNGPNAPEFLRPVFAALGGWLLADTPGGRDELRRLVDPAFRDMVDELAPDDSRLALKYAAPGTGLEGTQVEVMVTAVRVHDATGRLAGTALICKPAPGMAVLATVAAVGDLRHFERMQRVAKPGRRPAAILFADLEASSPLARRLSTAGYFALVRSLVRAADRCVIDAGGLVGRHAGDGVAAFFLAETAGSESAAARACITAARAFRGAVDDVAARSDLAGQDIVLRFGLHWGATPYVGQIATIGRTEVTALGDEVNEAARIEACATGGRALASKTLVERLSQDDAGALELDPNHVTYTRLGDLVTATEKARRDAPAIAVCEI
jgi:class 3 adenylate cyclase